MIDEPPWDSELGSVRARFDDSNPLVDVALGLLSASGELDAILAKYAPDDKGGTATAVDSTTEAGVAFVLGLIAFRNRLVRALAESPVSTPASPAPRAEADSRDSLLR